MSDRRGYFTFAIVFAPLAQHLSAQVLTRSYDNSRSGANIHENTITPATVGNLKKLRELTLDAGDDPRIEAATLRSPTANGGWPRA